MSRICFKVFCRSVASPGAWTNSWTQFCRLFSVSRSSKGWAIQRSRSRDPGGVTVPSMACRSEPCLPFEWPVADLKISRFCSVAGSIRRFSDALYSSIFLMFAGVLQSVSLAYWRTAPAAPRAGCWSVIPKPFRFKTSSVSHVVRAPAMGSKW